MTNTKITTHTKITGDYNWLSVYPKNHGVRTACRSLTEARDKRRNHGATITTAIPAVQVQKSPDRQNANETIGREARCPRSVNESSVFTDGCIWLMNYSSSYPRSHGRPRWRKWCTASLNIERVIDENCSGLLPLTIMWAISHYTTWEWCRDEDQSLISFVKFCASMLFMISVENMNFSNTYKVSWILY